MILAKYMQKNQSELKKKVGKGEEDKLTILEVGSGTGILGIFLGCLGWKVTLSDQAAVVSGATKPNIERNVNVLEKNGGDINIINLDW